MSDEHDRRDTMHDGPADAGGPHERRAVPRRDFLKGAALLSASTLFFPAYLLGNNGRGLACEPTTADIEGPFYKSGAPFRVALATESEPGDRLQISGVVYANDCTTPLPGVTVDVWGANNEGCYNNNVDCSPHSDDIYNLRGRMLTNERGEYAFATIKPGRYLNGSQYRPSHVHFRITAPGEPALVTQLYFEGDPYIPVDPWASESAAAARIIPLASMGDHLHGIFDISLDVGAIASAPYGASGRTDLLQNVPNPFAAETSIPYHVARPMRVDLAIFDMLGRRVRTLVSSMQGAGTYTERWDGRDDGGNELPADVYTCRMQAGGMSCSRKMVIVR
jgi:catechol 1,2-dioxygenase